jgi:transcriptional regulator with XRE-family HTH domain
MEVKTMTGKELKIKRVILGIKAKDVAEMLNIHSSYVCKIENNNRKVPSRFYKDWVRILGEEN